MIETWAGDTVGGTNVICGMFGDWAATSGTAGLNPCNSSFLSSSDAMRFRIRARVCFFSPEEAIESLRCRCVWNSGDLSPKARLMHSRS